MHGAIPLPIVARALLIMAGKCLLFLAPFLVTAALWWLVNRTDRLVHFLFPHLEWERSLGWLNIKAERRAKTALRWLGYGIQALLAVALLGMVWGAKGLQRMIDSWPDLQNAGDWSLRLAALIGSLVLWIVFLGSWLLPKMRTEREETELQKFRLRMDQEERERERRAPIPPSRVKSPLQKPRTNAPEAKPLHGRSQPGDRN